MYQGHVECWDIDILRKAACILQITVSYLYQVNIPFRSAETYPVLLVCLFSGPVSTTLRRLHLFQNPLSGNFDIWLWVTRDLTAYTALCVSGSSEALRPMVYIF
jgi:hypothetical protein